MRLLLATVLLTAASVLTVNVDLSGQEKKQPPAKKAKVDPKTFRPDAETLKQIQEKTEELRRAVAALQEKKIADDVLVEVAIYLKAAENIVRFEEWLHANSVRWVLQTLDQGLERAKLAEGGKAVWRDAPGKWVVRAYRSQIDDSIQPYAVLLPHDYGKDPKKKWRLDIVLHGRDSSLTEAKFIATHGTTAKEAPKDRDYIQLEPYGRGNNGYRWAGETDVIWSHMRFEVAEKERLGFYPFDPAREVIRGFSMGGAGAWHIGLHHPSSFCVIGPGAGFTTTRGYIPKLPEKLPEYQEKCLSIYDAYLYAENAFNVPIVAYSGEKDPQKKAADNIENALKGFMEPVKYSHLVASGLEHQMPAEWQSKAESEYRKHADGGRDPNPRRVRFVTYTPKYSLCDWVGIGAMETAYEKAIVDAIRNENSFTVTTTNVRRLSLFLHKATKKPLQGPLALTVDGQGVDLAGFKPHGIFDMVLVEKANGKWVRRESFELGNRLETRPEKVGLCSGPIDDAFTGRFVVVKPTNRARHPVTDRYPIAESDRFESMWERHFRGKLPVIHSDEYIPNFAGNLVLFGDPSSNPLIAKALAMLPIKWTKDTLVVNGVEYDPKIHIPVLIYPNPLNHNFGYIVLNSGHTFKEADLKGTNALLFPRLGDWAVIKPTPTKEDPAAYEVVAAGLFDENWQFKK